jgi:hypothetical protein
MFIAVLASIVLSAAASPATDQEKDLAAEIYMTCLLKAASQIEHSQSTDSAITAGIVVACRTNLQHMKDIYARGESSELADKISIHFEDLQQRSAERAVTIVRSARSGSSKTGS